MSTTYEQDPAAWAFEQAALLRAGRLSEADIANIAEEIEDVGKSELRELESRLAVLLAHLLKWKYQPQRQGASWTATLKVQRRRVDIQLKKTPSLRPLLQDAEFIAEVWDDAVAIAIAETGLATFSDECPWSMADVIRQDWLPQ